MKPSIYVPPRLPPELHRPTFAEVDLGAIAHNVRSIRGRIGARRGLMAVVKADAYGHGAREVARVALESGADWLGVALPEEGWALREEGIRAPTLVLGPTFPSQSRMILEADLVVGLFTWEVARSLDEHAGSMGKRAVVHVKVDTGMGRIGVPARDVIAFLEALKGLRHLEVQGIYTHFATADHPDSSFTRRQMDDFMEICREAASRGIRIPMKHLSNSAAILQHPEAFQDLVRPGIMIYGCYPSAVVQRSMELRPAMTLRTRVALVKDLQPGESLSYGRTFVASRPTRVGTLPIGYADGLSRSHSNRGEVLICGRRAPIIGTICMDMTLVDITHIPEAGVGDEAVIFGRQGSGQISVEEVAERIGTVSYEILCSVGARVPRLYLGGERVKGKGGEV